MSVLSHEEKMLNLQHQMRQNQSELQSYLAGLNDWESEIREKERKLKASQSDQTEGLPPVRNTIGKKKMKKKKKEKVVASNKSGRISGYDFRAWDKFDVDKALEEVDGQARRAETSSSEYETDEEWELERKKHLAELEKDKGNKFLKDGDFERAVEAYSKGMEFDTTNSILPANRALALIKQHKFAAAELDCTCSLALAPLYVKAYLRRAVARAGLGKTQDALHDYQRVLELEPTNKHARAELDRLEKDLSREEEEDPVRSSFSEGQSGLVKPVYKSLGERSKVPMKRIDIEEIGVEVLTRPQPSGQSKVAQQITAREAQLFDSLLSSNPPQTSANERPCRDTDTVSTAQLNSVKSGKDDQGQSEQTQSPLLVLSSRVSSQNQCQGAETVPSQNQCQGAETVSSQNQCQGAETVSSQAPLPVPQSSFQFQADFKRLKNKPDQFFQYFQAICPKQYPQLFGQCLDVEILNAILKALNIHTARSELDLFDVLHNLSMVKRFTMTAMFLSKEDKKGVADLLGRLTDHGQRTAQEVDTLRSKFHL